MKRRGRGGERGVTLAEAMIATAVFTTGILGVYAMLIYSYNMVTLARYRDNARAVLVSFADKFERLQTTDSSNNLRNFFDTSVATPNGIGLSWTDSSGNITTGSASGLTLTLGDAATSSVPAVVTELVQNLDADTGAVKLTGGNQAAGRMLQGTFTITYTIKGRVQTQTLVVARSVR